MKLGKSRKLKSPAGMAKYNSNRKDATDHSSLFCTLNRVLHPSIDAIFIKNKNICSIFGAQKNNNGILQNIKTPNILCHKAWKLSIKQTATKKF